MTIEEVYKELGGDYHDTKARLMSDKLIVRFLKKFESDGVFAELKQSLSDKDDETAFRAAHTLKGVAMNLGLGDLAQSSSAVTEALRGGRKAGVEELFEKCEQDYGKVMRIIGEISE